MIGEYVRLRKVEIRERLEIFAKLTFHDGLSFQL
jgi:hypothetical protein